MAITYLLIVRLILNWCAGVRNAPMSGMWSLRYKKSRISLCPPAGSRHYAKKIMSAGVCSLACTRFHTGGFWRRSGNPLQQQVIEIKRGAVNPTIPSSRNNEIVIFSELSRKVGPTDLCFTYHLIEFWFANALELESLRCPANEGGLIDTV
jgi:hypothetical protein